MANELQYDAQVLPWQWLGSTGYGGYGTVDTSSWDQLYSDFLTQQQAYGDLYNKAVRAPWWLSKRAQKDRLGALEAESNRITQTYDKLNTMKNELGLEGTAPDLEDFSKETMSQTLESASKQAADNKAASLKSAQKTAEYAGLVFDTARSLFNDNRDVYDGAKGHVAEALDATGDSVSNTLMASGNPWAMAAGAAYKGMGLLNQVIGHSTSGMTGTDAFLDSNLGFALLPGVGKLNAKFGTTTDKFEVDEDVKAAMGSSYLDTYGDLEDAESKANKRYGFLSRKASRKAQNEIHMAEQRQNTISDINDTAQDRLAAGGYEGISFRNQMNLSGGYKAMRAARKGLKMNLDFAHKVAKAQRGIRFNIFDMVEQPSVAPDAVQSPALVPPILDVESSLNPQKPITEQDFKELGVIFREVDDQGRLVYDAPWGLGDLLGKNQHLIDSLTKKYGAKGVVFNSVRQQNTEEQNTPSQGTNQEGNQENSQGSNQGDGQEGNQGSPSSGSQGSSQEQSVQQGEPPAQIEMPDLETGLTYHGFTEDEEAQFNEYLTMFKEGRWEELENLLKDPKTNDIIMFAESVFRQMLEPLNPEDQWSENTMWMGGTGAPVKHITITKYPRAYQPTDGQSESTRLNVQTNDGIEVRKQGGSFTFTPYTDEQVNKFKAGGSFNLIPDGALHKNRHNMEGAEGLTKKGIPVVTEEDGKKIQQAEIEVNEIIFRLEVTEKLEKLAKEGTDEAALEAGKLITEEILHNTHDNTGLIKETV